MKIGVLTHYDVASHGAYLQLYALCKLLEERGHRAYVLTYMKNFDFDDEDDANKYKANLSSVPYYLREYLVKNGPDNFLYQLRKQIALKSFGKRHFEYVDYASGDLDACVIGADEVLSLQHGINYMMYGHGVNARYVFAYAPSFGQTDIAEIDGHRARALIASGLRALDGVSVRDESSAAIIRELCSIDPEIVCDPAILYEFSKSKESIRELNVNERYMIVYAYTTNMNEKSIVERLKVYAKERQCILVSIEGYHSWCDKNLVCDPLEMLHLFAKAEAVFTDTFHGTISSIISRAPLVIFTRSSNNVKLSYLIKQLGLENRVVHPGRDFQSILKEDMDYEKINDRVRLLRLEGGKYLDKQLKRCAEVVHAR